jgi:Zn-dependent protease with chaperone function
MLSAFVAQSILHALAAGLIVEALLAAWRVDDAAWRLRFRLLALAEPILVLPLFFLVPWRADAAFAATWAVFATERWNLLRVGGQGLGDLVMIFAAGAGAALFLRDAAPPLLDALRGTSRHVALAPPDAVPRPVAEMVADHAAALGIDPPRIKLLRTRLPVLLCEHARRPALVLSVATIEQLDAPALDAAIAHEVAHAAHRDPAWGYGLIAARALTFFNPATQWTARALVDELERRADQIAERLTGRTDALAQAIRVLSLAAPMSAPEVGDRFQRLFWQSRVAAVSRRCERLRTRPQPARLAHGVLRLGLAAAGLVGLLFFVV